VHHYLSSLTPDWPEVPRIDSSASFDLREFVGETLQRAAADMGEQAKRVRTPSKKRALESITQFEKEALEELAIQIMTGATEGGLEDALKEITGNVQ
jgi:hypothetical protein